MWVMQPYLWLGLCVRKPQRQPPLIEFDQMHEMHEMRETDPSTTPQFRSQNGPVYQHEYDDIGEEATPNVEPYCSTVVHDRSHRNPMFDNQICNVEVHPHPDTSNPEVFVNERYNEGIHPNQERSVVVESENYNRTAQPQPVVFVNERYESVVAVNSQPEAIATMSDSGLYRSVAVCSHPVHYL